MKETRCVVQVNENGEVYVALVVRYSGTQEWHLDQQYEVTEQVERAMDARRQRLALPVGDREGAPPP
jgi:hypothetical protein